MANPTPPDTTAAPTTTTESSGKIDVSTLLNLGDVGAAATVSLIEYALGERVTFSKALTATAISAVSRIITQNFTTLSSAGGNITEDTTKDAFIVALINALVAYGMKRSVAKTVAIGVAADVLSDRIITMISLDPKSSLFKSKN